MTFQHCRSLRTLMVMLVSSVWHGVHPGYYLSLGSVPFCLMVSRTTYVYTARRRPPLTHKPLSISSYKDKVKQNVGINVNVVLTNFLGGEH